MKIIKITKWSTCKLQCVKAVKELMDLTLRGAKDMVENSKMPCVLRVYDDEKLQTFLDYTQTSCSGMNYTVEDADDDTDTPNEETSEDYSDKTLLAISKMEEGQKCVGEAKQMLLSQIRFLNASLKGVVIHKEELKAKVEDLTRQNEALREYLKRTKMDMGPADVKKEYDDWCKKQITEQIGDYVDAELANRERSLQKKTINFKEDDGAVQEVDKSKYYNAVFQHIKWEHAQQLLTLAKQLNIEFGKIESE